MATRSEEFTSFLAFRRLCFLSFLAFIFLILTGLNERGNINTKAMGISNEKISPSFTASPCKLFQFDDDGGDMNRIRRECSKGDIAIFQGQIPSLPNGIPEFTVQILNSCVSGCSISDIHVSCGWFSSARLVNPRVFRRLLFDDCLVNDGEPLGPGETLSFQYANTFQYPLSVTSVACL